MIDSYNIKFFLFYLKIQLFSKKNTYYVYLASIIKVNDNYLFMYLDQNMKIKKSLKLNYNKRNFNIIYI